MKKTFLLLPIAISMALVACTQNGTGKGAGAEVSDVSNTTAMPDWQSGGSVQSADMPASMNSAPAQTMGQAQGAYNNAQGTYNSVQQSVPQIPQQVPQPVSSAPTSTPAQPQAQPQSQSMGASTGSEQGGEMIGQCRVVRNPAGTPVYPEMTKGCYTDSYYTVGKKDTIYFISFLTGQTPDQIATLNNITTTAPLKVGQVLQVR